MYNNNCTCNCYDNIHLNIHIYIYIHIEIERERETYTCVHVHVHIEREKCIHTYIVYVRAGRRSERALLRRYPSRPGRGAGEPADERAPAHSPRVVVVVVVEVVVVVAVVVVVIVVVVVVGLGRCADEGRGPGATNSERASASGVCRERGPCQQARQPAGRRRQHGCSPPRSKGRPQKLSRGSFR